MQKRGGYIYQVALGEFPFATASSEKEDAPKIPFL